MAARRPFPKATGPFVVSTFHTVVSVFLEGVFHNVVNDWRSHRSEAVFFDYVHNFRVRTLVLWL